MDRYKEGMELYYRGEYEKASELFIELLNQDNTHHKAWNALGVCLKNLGDIKQAKDCFENAVRLSPKNVTYNRSLNLIGKELPEEESNAGESPESIKHKKTYSYQTDKTEVICLILGLFLLGVYLFSLMFTSIITSPAREFIGLGGMLFFFFFVSASIFKTFVQCRIPIRLILFVGLIVTLIILFVKYILDNFGAH